MTLTGQFVGWCRQFLHALGHEAKNRDPVPPPVINPYCDRQDFWLVILFASALFTGRLVVERMLLRKIFSNSKARMQKKMSENLYYSIFYSASFAMFMIVMRGEDWSVWPFTNESIVRVLVDPYFPTVSRSMKLYYLFQLGFYISATIIIVFIDPRRSDFTKLLIHHISTIFLVALSYVFAYMRFGILIMALHDVGDIFLYSAKFVHYLGYTPLDTLIFAVFAVTFYVTRLVILPRITFAAGVETIQLVIDEPGINQWAAYYDIFLLHWLCFVVLLSILQLLHCFWFSLILQMIHKKLFLGRSISGEGDPRSDDEEEDGQYDEEEDGPYNDESEKRAVHKRNFA